MKLPEMCQPGIELSGFNAAALGSPAMLDVIIGQQFEATPVDVAPDAYTASFAE